MPAARTVVLAAGLGALTLLVAMPPVAAQVQASVYQVTQPAAIPGSDPARPTAANLTAWTLQGTLERTCVLAEYVLEAADVPVSVEADASAHLQVAVPPPIHFPMQVCATQGRGAAPFQLTAGPTPGTPLGPPLIVRVRFDPPPDAPFASRPNSAEASFAIAWPAPPPPPVPAPPLPEVAPGASVAMLAVGLAGLAVAARRRT